MFFNNIILGMPKIDESLKLKCTFLTAQYGAFCQKKTGFWNINGPKVGCIMYENNVRV